MLRKLIFCLILAIYPLTSFATDKKCMPVNKKRIIYEYRAGKWKKGRCIYKKRKRRRRRRKRRMVYVCKKRAPKVVIIKNICKPNVVVINSSKPKSSKDRVVIVPTTKSQKKQKKKSSDFFTWDFGPGVFALGIFNTSERRFLTGFYGTAVFRFWDRLKIAGFLGGSLWQDGNVYIASLIGVRVYKRLHLIAVFHSFWGDFVSIRIKRRLLFGGVGADYLIVKKLNISLEFLAGQSSFVPPTCDNQEDSWMLGAMFKAMLYF